ncbi:MAG: hypothetical protein ACD_3C00211G0001, partial [uncultured bacterium (gcode 4)]
WLEYRLAMAGVTSSSLVIRSNEKNEKYKIENRKYWYFYNFQKVIRKIKTR